ncbi:oxidoreductase [Heterostelium album PN500]|uniref:Oxidoreductase n=1 Tax=Heterostelium pallidum (strain ATCC 26659 / Pp 5 / PN500) TaxID=670386 RepID=D3BLG0_HETP5|nr:oxidoreductase [Heterostelium album PN500]EFA77894.1 oxidoreductase [Heterostelium album PN500]|eukprot:XP_020430022.1 oxidoreductase [Heterostelium album PN500]
MKWKMGNTNREWLGFFKVGQEMTYGSVDWKEGWYIDCQKEGDIKPAIGVPLFPTAEQELENDIQGFKDIIETYIKRVSALAQDIMEAMALSLNLPRDFFFKKYTYDPFTQMAMLHYPSFHKDKNISNPDDSSKIEKFGTGPHTDQGFLTILHQDNVGGLQVQLKDKPGHYIDAPPIPGTFICNLGDMLDKSTNGYYLSNVHRVKYNMTGRDRYSFAFFFDPNLDSVPELIPSEFVKQGEKPERWDKQNIHEGFSGTYGDYFMAKIGRIFPDYVYKSTGKLT